MPASAGKSATRLTSSLASATRRTSHLPSRCSFELASPAQPDLVVRGYGSAPQPGIDLEDPVCDRAELPCRGDMLRIGVGVLAGRRRQVFAPIATFEVAQPRRGAFKVFAGPRPD